jgi:transposase
VAGRGGGRGSYGAALARHLRAAGVEVIEVNAPDKPTRRRRGKTDTLDAQAAARAVLSGRASGSAKTGGDVADVEDGPKILPSRPAARRSNQLKAVLVAADPALREALSGLTNPSLRLC